MDDEREQSEEAAPATEDGAPDSAGPGRTSRRELLRRAGIAGLAVAGGLPAASWLAGCGTSVRTASPARSLTPTATRASTATATPDDRPVTIVITGDVMLARSVNSALLASNDRFPFNYTADYLSGFDLTVGNLECVVSTLGSPQPKEFTFEANPKAFERLRTASFDVMSVANNHSGDYGKLAFSDMLGQLLLRGIQPLGGGMNLAEAHQPVIRAIRTTRLGFLAYCEIEPQSFVATATTAGHAWLDPVMMQSDIKAARPHADFLIVFTHWGIEYQLAETDHQQAMARLAIDAGADLVVGAHPHVIQPYEMYHGKLIVYSLGNFVFDLMTGVEGLGNVLALTVQGSRLLSWKLREMQLGAYGQPSWV